jgi:hypothetical protein
MNELTTPSERHYRFHLRRMSLGLAFSVAMGAGMIVALILPGLLFALLFTPPAVFIVSMIALDVALRGRAWRRHDLEDRRIWTDERVKANADRSRRMALRAVYVVQVPLMFVAAYAQPDPPSVETATLGMAMLTMACGAATFFASYLRYSWLDAHG